MSIPTPPPGDQSGRREPLRPTESAAHDAWSLRVATVSGIPIRLHFTFLLLVTFVALNRLGRGGTEMVFFLLGIFLCVVLHELRH